MSIGNVFIYVPAKLLYLLNIFLKICTVAGILYLLHQAATDKSSRNKPFVWFFIVLYITLWGYSFKYAMDYPYACSTDYRLFAQLILPETAILCLCAARILRSGCRKAHFLYIYGKSSSKLLACCCPSLCPVKRFYLCVRAIVNTCSSILFICTVYSNICSSIHTYRL